MMSSVELQQYLSILGLTPAEVAQLLSVDPRTIRRWLDGEDVPGPVEQAFRAWRRLHDRNLAWRPDSVSIIEDDQEQIALHRAHAIDLAALMARVEARGGARLPWVVDRERRRAVMGPMEVSYYPLANGGFSLAHYTRKDRDPDVRRDWELIEEAAYYIAKDFAATTIHIFRYGRSHLHAATLDKSGATLPPQDVRGMWRYVASTKYDPDEESRRGPRPFDPAKALADIETDGYHLFEANPRFEIIGSPGQVLTNVKGSG
jgi:hypothetical protein